MNSKISPKTFLIESNNRIRSGFFAIIHCHWLQPTNVRIEKPAQGLSSIEPNNRIRVLDSSQSSIAVGFSQRKKDNACQRQWMIALNQTCLHSYRQDLIPVRQSEYCYINVLIIRLVLAVWHSSITYNYNLILYT